MGSDDKDRKIKEMVGETKAEYKQLGKCGLKVSVPILGAMSFGDPKSIPWALDEEKASPALSVHQSRETLTRNAVTPPT